MDGVNAWQLVDDIADLRNDLDEISDALACADDLDHDQLTDAALKIASTLSTLIGVFRAFKKAGADVEDLDAAADLDALAIAIVNFPKVAAEAVATCQMVEQRIRAVA